MDIFEVLYNNSKKASILCNIAGEDCILNLQAKNLFSIKKLESIYDLFKDISLTENPPHFSSIDKDGNIHNIRCHFIEEMNYWLINIDEHNLSDWEEFVEYQKILHEVYLDLYQCKDEKEIYKRVVEDGINKLGIDRIGILLFSIEENIMLGSWGTDENGVIVDQSDFSSNLDNEKWCLEALNRRNYVVVHYDIPLLNRNIQIGVGWNAVAAFYDGDKPIGWIACDNYLTKRPLPPWKKEVIGELGRITGRLVSRIREEARLQEMVDERTKSLKESMNKLIEAEKMASLGALVAGVSHELNTPVGIALTAASHITESTSGLKSKFESTGIRKQDLIKFLNDSLQSGEITVSSLKRAADLVNSFKKLAVDRSQEVKVDINLYDLLETIIMSLKFSQSNEDIVINNFVDNKINLFSYAADFVQIFTNLIQNSFTHGFQDKRCGAITITSKIEGANLKVTYCDNGTGFKNVDLSKVFEPFYTSSRSSGGAGLGLSIIYNLVHKLGGEISIVNVKKGLCFRMIFPLGCIT